MEGVKTSILIKYSHRWQLLHLPDALATNRNKLTAGGAACQDTKTDERNLTSLSQVFSIYLFKFCRITVLKKDNKSEQ